MVKKPTVRRPRVAANAPADTSLKDSAQLMFGDGDKKLILRDGREVVIHHAKTKHIGLLLDFFHGLVLSLNREQVVELVKLIEDRFAVKKADSSTEKEAKTETVEELVQKVFGRTELALHLLHSVNDSMPKLVEALSNISAQDYPELDLDEGAMVAVKVFEGNYRFFSQNLPQVMQSALRLALAKASAK